MKAPNLIKSMEAKNWVIFYTFVFMMLVIIDMITFAFFKYSFNYYSEVFLTIIFIHLAVAFIKSKIALVIKVPTIIVVVLSVILKTLQWIYNKPFYLISTMVNYSLIILICIVVIYNYKKNKSEE